MAFNFALTSPDGEYIAGCWDFPSFFVLNRAYQYSLSDAKTIGYSTLSQGSGGCLDPACIK